MTIKSHAGSLGSISANPEEGADKRECKFLSIEPLIKVMVEITPKGHNRVMKLGLVQDSGAMVMAIPVTHAKGLRLNHT
jgi:hypothetical protein